MSEDSFNGFDLNIFASEKLCVCLNEWILGEEDLLVFIKPVKNSAQLLVKKMYALEGSLRTEHDVHDSHKVKLQAIGSINE